MAMRAIRARRLEWSLGLERVAREAFRAQAYLTVRRAGIAPTVSAQTALGWLAEQEELQPLWSAETVRPLPQFPITLLSAVAGGVAVAVGERQEMRDLLEVTAASMAAAVAARRVAWGRLLAVTAARAVTALPSSSASRNTMGRYYLLDENDNVVNIVLWDGNADTWSPEPPLRAVAIPEVLAEQFEDG